MDKSHLGIYDNEILLKAIDVANILNISRSLAYKLISQGEIRSVVIASSKRVRLKDLKDFIQASLTPPKEEHSS